MCTLSYVVSYSKQENRICKKMHVLCSAKFLCSQNEPTQMHAGKIIHIKHDIGSTSYTIYDR